MVGGGEGLFDVLLGVGAGKEPFAVHVGPDSSLQEFLTECDVTLVVYLFVEGTVVGEGGLGGEGHGENGGWALYEDVLLVLAGKVSEAVHEKLADVVHASDGRTVVLPKLVDCGLSGGEGDKVAAGGPCVHDSALRYGLHELSLTGDNGEGEAAGRGLGQSG